jgi:hypothetical protein
MSDAPGAGGSPASELQFDHVEYATAGPAAACKGCGQPMRDVYYEVNGQPFCDGCREQIQNALGGGSAFGRFVRATLYGSLAGLAGAAIYYGVREVTHYEIGIISVVVGLMTGKAVKTGCNARGGWLYQGLAIFLTYTAIVSTYIPPVINALRDRADEKAPWSLRNRTPLTMRPPLTMPRRSLSPHGRCRRSSRSCCGWWHA